ncbi:TIR-like protein FxsC [Sphaerisporangium album]|nr:TIR-like protein FxsC [Sphaerisporangium album]
MGVFHCFSLHDCFHRPKVRFTVRDRDALGVDPLVREVPRAAPYFFLSYAHTPRHDLNDPYDPDQWVEKLFNDLCRHVMVLTGLPRGVRPGFMDRELHPGSVWPDRLAEALATCRVFVPLYSRRYFESEQCGKEWMAFAQRILHHRARGSEKVETIVPALWVPVPVDELPEVSRSIQFVDPDLGARYAEHGFYGIMKLRQFRSAYDLAVYNLARRIVEVGDRANLSPMAPADYESLESAFGAGDHTRPNGHRLRVTVVAPDITDLPKGRGPYHYGHNSQEWNPYRPKLGRPLAEHTADIVRSMGHRPEVGSLAEHAEQITDDGAPTCPGLLLMDAWAATSPAFKESLRALDDAHCPWISVMVPWNQDDHETTQATPVLRDSLHSVLPRKLEEGRIAPRAAAHGIPTLDQFTKQVPEIARSAIAHYLRHATAHPPEGRPSIERPRLQGPMSPFDGNDAEASP